MNLVSYFQPLPLGTTTATLRRFHSIKPHVQTNKDLIVRVFANESASALQQLLQTLLTQQTVRVYVYATSSALTEVSLLQEGTELHLERCKIEPSNDILKQPSLDETTRRQWRTMIAAYLNAPYLMELPTPETNALLLRWIEVARAKSATSLLMDDIIDAVLSMMQAKQVHPYDEAYVMQTTAVAGVYFAGSILQQTAEHIASKVALARLAYGPGVASRHIDNELERFIWEHA